MNDSTHLTSVDWRTVAAVVSIVCTVLGAIVSGSTWYLKRLIRDSFGEFTALLDERFVHVDTYRLDQTKIAYDAKDLTRRVVALETGLGHGRGRS